MKTKIVPYKWYNEIVNELANACITYGAHFGIDSEQYKSAKERRAEFKEKYKPSSDIKFGCLSGAKAEVLLRKDKIKKSLSIKSQHDPYNFLGSMSEKYFLCRKQTNQLMDFMDKLELLY